MHSPSPSGMYLVTASEIPGNMAALGGDSSLRRIAHHNASEDIRLIGLCVIDIYVDRPGIMKVG